MVSNQKIQSMLKEITDISKTELLLYDEKGKFLASTMKASPELEREVQDFASSMAEIQVLSGYHVFKVTVEQDVEYILLAKAGSDEAYMVGRLAECQ